MITIHISQADGHDANDGLAKSTAVATFARADEIWEALDQTAVEDGVRVIVHDGTFREQVPFTTRFSRVPELLCLPGADGSPPDFRGSDIVTPSLFVPHPTEANVYEFAWAQDPASGATAKEFLGVWENDIPLTYVDTAADCSATPGSYSIEGFTYSDGGGDLPANPLTIYLHPIGSTDPRTSERTYEASRRPSGINNSAGNDNARQVITGGKWDRATSGDGYVRAGDYSVIQNLYTDDTHVHAILAGPGLMRRIVVLPGTLPTSDIVHYEPDPSAMSYRCEQVGFTNPTANKDTVVATDQGGFFHHGSGVSQWHHVELIQCFSAGLQAPFKAGSQQFADVTECVFVDGAWHQQQAGKIRYRRCLIAKSNDATNFASVSGDVEFLDGAYYSGAANNVGWLCSGSTIERLAFLGSTIILDGGRSLFEITSSSQNIRFDLQGNIVWGAATNTMFEVRPDGTDTLNIDRNLYCVPGHSHQVRLKLDGGTLQTTLAAWQTASGQDLNSAYVDGPQEANFWLGDPDGYDLRINPAAECTWADGTVANTLPDGTPLIELGQRNPIQSKPIIPLTKDDAKRFVAGLPRADGAIWFCDLGAGDGLCRTPSRPMRLTELADGDEVELTQAHQAEIAASLAAVLANAHGAGSWESGGGGTTTPSFDLQSEDYTSGAPSAFSNFGATFDAATNQVAFELAGTTSIQGAHAYFRLKRDRAGVITNESGSIVGTPTYTPTNGDVSASVTGSRVSYEYQGPPSGPLTFAFVFELTGAEDGDVYYLEHDNTTAFAPDHTAGFAYSASASSGGSGLTTEQAASIALIDGIETRTQSISTALALVPTATQNAAAVRANLALELGRIDENVSAPKTLTAATLATLFDGSDAAQQLTDFFAGLIERFDDAGDTPVSTIVSAMIAGLVAHADWIELLADAEAARAAAVANGQAIASLPTSVETTANKDEILASIGSGGSGGGGSGDASLSKQNEILSEISKLRPTSSTFSNQNRLNLGETIYIKQRDDYAAIDGRAFEFAVSKPEIDFSSESDVVIGAAAGGILPNAPTLVATPSLHDRANGSVTLRIEFTSAQTNVEPNRYTFDAHILVRGRRVTTTDINVEVEPKYGDAPAST